MLIGSFQAQKCSYFVCVYKVVLLATRTYIHTRYLTMMFYRVVFTVDVKTDNWGAGCELIIYMGFQPDWILNEQKKKAWKWRQYAEGEGFLTNCLGDEPDNFPMCDSKHCCFHCDSPVRSSLQMAMRLLDHNGHNRMPTKSLCPRHTMLGKETR